MKNVPVRLPNLYEGSLFLFIKGEPMVLTPVMEDLFKWCKEHQTTVGMPKNLYSKLGVLRAAKAGRLKTNLTRFYPEYDVIAKQIGMPTLFDKPHRTTPQESYNKHAQPIEDKQQAKYLKDAQELVAWIKAHERLPLSQLADKEQNRLASFMRRLIQRTHPYPDHEAYELAMPVIKQYKAVKGFKLKLLLTWAKMYPDRTDVPKSLRGSLSRIRYLKNNTYHELVQINPNLK